MEHPSSSSSSSPPRRNNVLYSSPEFSSESSASSSSSSSLKAMEALEIDGASLPSPSPNTPSSSSSSFNGRCQTAATHSYICCLEAMLFHPCLADAIMPDMLMQHGKQVALGLLPVCVLLDLVWLPFYLLGKYVVYEVGVYILSVCLVFWIGRIVIRMIAFPGSSRRVQNEIQGEFAKYSIKILEAMCDELSELSVAIQSRSTLQYELRIKWERAEKYRRRVIGMLHSIISHLSGDEDDVQLVTKNDGDDESCLSNLDSYGNNIFVGDLGKAPDSLREDSDSFKHLLARILSNLSELDEHIESCLKANTRIFHQKMKSKLEIRVENATKDLKKASMELKDLLPSLLNNSDTQEDPAEGNASTLEMMYASLSSITPFLDPPRYESIFSLDLIRGCVLSRYNAAKQVWIDRSDGGRIDCIHFRSDQQNGQNKTAVVYCNPNAGLYETGTGFNFFGGNISKYSDSDGKNNWTDYYLGMGYDVFLFNYAGYGRSHGKNVLPQRWTNYRTGRFASSLIDFVPSPYSLQQDAVDVIKYVKNMQFESIILHGESIGGMAAASAASTLSLIASNSANPILLLICDRTFCNLEAVAQRLVGKWTANAIRLLAPFWNTDVAGNFLSSTCPCKIVATDTADAIIADASSLKSGISVSIELSGHKSKDVCWMRDIPRDFRMAEWENVGIWDYIRHPSSPCHGLVWPADKRISLEKAYVFAYSARRIGKVATAAKRGLLLSTSSESVNSSEGFEVSRCLVAGTKPDVESHLVASILSEREQVSILTELWYYVACCDGLCGCTLGHAVKGGLDETIIWLCNLLVFGGQHVASEAAKRNDGINISVQDDDFGANYDYSDECVRMLSIASVISRLDHIYDKYCQNNEKNAVSSLRNEILFVKTTFQYVVDRLSYHSNLVTSLDESLFRSKVNNDSSKGFFFNLSCGHNAMLSSGEQEQFCRIVKKALLIEESRALT